MAQQRHVEDDVAGILVDGEDVEALDVEVQPHRGECAAQPQRGDAGSPGQRDKVFLARAFQKLLLNFTWWVNRKDPRGKNIFAGGFLGLDNIGVFDRSKPLPEGHLEQADGTSWMAFYCGTMLSIALNAESSLTYCSCLPFFIL